MNQAEVVIIDKKKVRFIRIILISGIVLAVLGLTMTVRWFMLPAPVFLKIPELMENYKEFMDRYVQVEGDVVKNSVVYSRDYNAYYAAIHDKFNLALKQTSPLAKDFCPKNYVVSGVVEELPDQVLGTYRKRSIGFKRKICLNLDAYPDLKLPVYMIIIGLGLVLVSVKYRSKLESIYDLVKSLL